VADVPRPDFIVNRQPWHCAAPVLRVRLHRQDWHYRVCWVGNAAPALVDREGDILNTGTGERQLCRALPPWPDSVAVVPPGRRFLRLLVLDVASHATGPQLRVDDVQRLAIRRHRHLHGLDQLAVRVVGLHDLRR
jgi:hypothetical protein